MYAHSWTSIGRLRAWRCRSQECVAFCHARWACLRRQCCGSVRLARRCFRLFLRVLHFFRLWSWLQWCFPNVWSRGYVLPMAEEVLSGICPLLDWRRTQATKVGFLFQVIRRIRDYGLQSREHRLLFVSLSAPTEETFCTLRGNKDLQEVRNNGWEISMSR